MSHNDTEGKNASVYFQGTLLARVDAEVKRNPNIRSRSDFIGKAIEEKLELMFRKEVIKYESWRSGVNLRRLKNQFEKVIETAQYLGKTYAELIDTQQTYNAEIVWNMCLRDAGKLLLDKMVEEHIAQEQAQMDYEQKMREEEREADIKADLKQVDDEKAAKKGAKKK